MKFSGGPSDNHGLDASHASIQNLVTIGASFNDGAFEYLNGAEIQFIWDAPASWPKQGKLDIGQLKYQAFGAPSPVDVASRLHWLGLSATSSDPQPYDEWPRLPQRRRHQFCHEGADRARRCHLQPRRLNTTKRGASF